MLSACGELEAIKEERAAKMQANSQKIDEEARVYIATSLQQSRQVALDELLASKSPVFELAPNLLNSDPNLKNDQTIREAEAQSGDAVSQYELGRFYLFEGRTREDRLHGIEWLEQSAAQNNLKAHLALGNFYYYLKDTAHTEISAKQRAITHFRPLKKDAEAAFKLAGLYSNESLFPPGEQPNFEESLYLYNFSAQNGNSQAQRKLSDLYRQGASIDRDLVLALKWALIIDYIPNRSSENPIVVKLRSEMTPEEQKQAEELAAQYFAKDAK